MAGQAASAIYHARLLEETRHRLVELEAVNKISIALRVARTIDEILPLLIEETLAVFGCEAGILWLYDSDSDEIRQVVARGWFKQVMLEHPIKMNGIPKQVFITGEAYRSSEFKRGPGTLSEESFGIGDFCSHFPANWGGACIPIQSSEGSIGVLFVAVPHPRELTTSDVRLLTTLAGIAGNAIHRMRLHFQTEQHLQRLTALHVVELALGASLDLRVILGALLHDMGKMGVPDSILLKPDKLSESEWAIMRQHPQFAYDMFSKISYLKAALDIPYCHHEKWDGSGYPQGLKNEQIPLAARLFAVVDIWDALRSDRPYRKAWPEEKVLNHIRSLAGTHLDPKAVDLFCQVAAENSTDNPVLS